MKNCQPIRLSKIIGLGAIVCLSHAVSAQNAEERQKQAANEATQIQIIQQLSEDLKHPFSTVRDRAAVQILRSNDIVRFSAFKVFQNMRSNPPADRYRFDGSFANVMWILGDMRVIEARGSLFDILDFQLDPTTVPIATSPRSIDYYPAAKAISEMPGLRAIEKVFEEVASPSNELRLRICARLLSGWLGKPLAEAAVQMRLTAETDRLNKAQLESSNRKKNLEKMKAFFESEEPILPIPEAKTPATDKIAVAKQPAG